MRRLWIGIDPGQRWTGYAMLHYFRGEWRAEARVFDLKDYKWTDLVDELVRDAYRSYVICEDFQARKAFTNLDTVKLIGAIRFAAEKRDAVFSLVRTGNPDAEIEMMGLGPFLEPWAKQWPHASHREWHHARSAWRVLAQWLLQHNLDALKILTEAEPTYKRNGGRLFQAPAAVWQQSLQLDVL